MRLRTLLSILLAGMLMVTSGYIGWLGYSTSRGTIKMFAQQEFELANGIAAHEVSDFLNDPANRLLEEFTVRARRGMMTLTDDRGLGFNLAERLRVNPTLAWISYSDAQTGRFVGVWRNKDGAIILNTATPTSIPVESVVTIDGTMLPYVRPRQKAYDPRTHDWFKNAMASTTTIWSEPYEFEEGVPGITASRAWRASDTAAPIGVFTVDFYLADLRGLLDDVARNFHGISAILAPSGKLICASQHGNDAMLTDAISTWVTAHPEFKDGKGPLDSHLFPIDIGGVHYRAAVRRVAMPSGFTCIVAGMVPESVLFSKIDQTGHRMEGVGFLGLLIAVSAGCFIAYRVSEPLRALGNDLAKVGDFNLAPQHVSRSVVSEVNQLRDASDRMKTGLRSFTKYMPDDVVRRLLSTGKEATLGGEMRRLTVFLSDIEGFATHTEQVACNVLVRELAGYFEILSRRVRQHSGTIDKFIGDGLLAFFNAPELVPHHENLACRAALIGLQELDLRQKEGAMVPFRTRVGLHCGEVLVGNIGTPERFAYTVLGDVVNVTSRLENLNKIYGTTIIASGDLRAAAGEDFEWRHLDRVAVVGRQGRTDIFELMGLKDGVDEDRLHARKLYDEALGLYLARSFWDARRIFSQVVEQRPGDKAALLMMTRCEHMVAQEPPTDWDGVFVYSRK